jgi:hypothetical protein
MICSSANLRFIAHPSSPMDSTTLWPEFTGLGQWHEDVGLGVLVSITLPGSQARDSISASTIYARIMPYSLHHDH